MTYIAFLRGINIGGHLIKMEKLCHLFSQLGLINVRSYIQTGNVFFHTSKVDRYTLIAKIEKHLHQTLGYEVPVFLRTVEEIETLLNSNPFQSIELAPDKRFCIMFTKDKIPQDLTLPLMSPKQDMELIHVTEHEAFVVWHLINGRPPSSVKFLDPILGKQTTSRFFHTLKKILQAAKAE
jgi:uncharacterized protein (DUF1697 family)